MEEIRVLSFDEDDSTPKEENKAKNYPTIRTIQIKKLNDSTKNPSSEPSPIVQAESKSESSSDTKLDKSPLDRQANKSSKIDIPEKPRMALPMELTVIILFIPRKKFFLKKEVFLYHTLI